jgi:signal transduction histidine kinase
MRKENHNIKETLEKAIESVRPESESKNIKINLNSEDIMLNYDSDRISQVIANLIKNSINAIESDSGKIDVKVENHPAEVKISVKDNGIGIAPEKQKDLFKKFYQVDASLTREKGGSGLGLAICKGIVENHMGRIGVESIPNQGSTFYFTIPKNPSETKSPLGIA